MRTALRILVAVVTAPLWVPFVAVYAILVLPFVLIGMITTLWDFVLTGEWEWKL